jgi:hypothetical protein
MEVFEYVVSCSCSCEVAWFNNLKDANEYGVSHMENYDCETFVQEVGEPISTFTPST